MAILVAACGDNRHVPAVPDAPPPAACTATYSGNLAETATADACVMLTGTQLVAKLPSTRLDASLDFMIELGTTAIAGTYSSAAASGPWSASGTRTVDQQFCHYSAGSASAPHGSFTLVLDAALHGHLALETAVLADPFTNCGDPITLAVGLAF